MEIEHVATIRFVDVDSEGDALAIVRAAEDLVVLGLSLLSNGDLEVAMRYEDFGRLLDSLHEAAAIAKRKR